MEITSFTPNPHSPHHSSAAPSSLEDNQSSNDIEMRKLHLRNGMDMDTNN